MTGYAVNPASVVLAAVFAVAVDLAVLPTAPAAAAAHRRRPAPAAVHHRHHRPAKPSPAKPSTPPPGLAAVCPDTGLTPTPDDVSAVAAAVLCLINKQRAAGGLRLLEPNPALAAAARAHSSDMVAGDYFDHVSPSGDGPLERLRHSGYLTPGVGFVAGENIAAALGDRATPAATVARWMGSPEHRANILSPAFRDTGIGVAPAAPASLGSGPGATYTEEFGSLN
ncbi:MAG: hypothetical protein QOF77_1768 [Solirubrobacteraceae bacterium]|nr:hypothetical protein [Solirubrobacteraceae bacterium]